MPKIVKFHSIYYRFVLFIVFLYLFVVYQIAGREIQEFTIFNYAFSFHQTQLGYCLLLLILVGIGINFLYLQKGFILEDQLYLFLGVILVEFRMFGLTRRVILVEGLIFITVNVQFYRHDYKPICIYNISLLALFSVKLFKPQIKTNVLSASFATGFNILLNTSIVCYLYFLDLKTLSFSYFLLFCLLYFIKIFIIPLCLVSSQNSKYGPYLVHSSFFKRNASDVIHV